jgi:hypothetical protein
MSAACSFVRVRFRTYDRRRIGAPFQRSARSGVPGWGQAPHASENGIRIVGRHPSGPIRSASKHCDPTCATNGRTVAPLRLRIYVLAIQPLRTPVRNDAEIETAIRSLGSEQGGLVLHDGWVYSKPSRNDYLNRSQQQSA